MMSYVLPVVAIWVRKAWNQHTVVEYFSYEVQMTQNIQKDHCFQSQQQKLIWRDVSVKHLLPLLLLVPRTRLCNSSLVLSKVTIASTKSKQFRHETTSGDSSVGRASDWRSEGRVFDPRSPHYNIFFIFFIYFFVLTAINNVKWYRYCKDPTSIWDILYNTKKYGIFS